MVTTRTQSYTPPPYPQDPLTHRLTTYALHLSTSTFAPLLHSLINHSLPRHAPHPLFRPQNRAHLLRESLLILCSTSPVVHAAVAGTLTAQLLTPAPTPADLALRQDYAVLQERAASGQPCVYVHVLADERGCAPSPEDMLVLAEALARYTAPAATADEGLVERVDALGPPPSAGRGHDGRRVGKYLPHSARIHRSCVL
ncbi:hypothetical protein BS50DRAFT_631427 [Corynespora cassiicola Philippines]|uniref:Uncharacterized protein n=1 Tax=Corynespora cassiicola Philippines TaxID=1448308 RepID=A0A2T2P2B1_CORCC|nr:hypothetical protein BS50DRAFT_631427 [Corynespora cassiicola Philippines]